MLPSKHFDDGYYYPKPKIADKKEDKDEYIVDI